MKHLRLSLGLGMLFIAAAVAGCTKSNAETLEANYTKTVDSSGSNRERCAAQRELAEAYSREGNTEKYDDWRGKAVMTCMWAGVGR